MYVPELYIVLNIYIVYELSSNLNYIDPSLESCLFSAVRLTKTANIDKDNYLGYGIGFDARGTFSFPVGSFAKNSVILGADMNSFVHGNNKTKDILILDEGLT